MPGCLLILILFPVLYYGLYFLLRGARPANPQRIAHRGGPAHAPENTMAAFRHAISIGMDWIELDVQMTQDGALVIIHDETVDRTTNGTGAVRELTLEQIRTLNAGNGEQVPTFEEVITLAKEAGVGLLPEVKKPHLYPEIETKIVQTIVEANYIEKTLIQSFDPQVLNTILTINPEIQICRLYGLWEFNVSKPQPTEVKTLCPMAEMVILYPWMIRQIHAKGRPAYVWFGIIEHPLTMRFILAIGADGLMVDNPIALNNILN